MSDSIEEELRDISSRLKKLEEEKKPKKSWRELATGVGVPLALVTSMLAFYDTIWLRIKHEDPATIQAVEEKFVELQDLNSEIYQLLNENDAGGLAGLDEAKRGRKERLVTSIFGHYEDRPDYFNYHEKQALANELLLRGDTADALEIASSMEAESRNIFEAVDLLIFQARILQSDGAVFDLDGARGKLKEAITRAQEITRDTPKEEMWAKIAYYWLFVETYHEQACDDVQKPATFLYELTTGSDYPIDLGVLNADAMQLMNIADARCGSPEIVSPEIGG